MNESFDEIPMMELPGKRIVLRALNVSDAEMVFRAIDSSRDHLSKHLPWPGECHTADDVAGRIDAWELQAQMGSGGCWGIFETTDSQSAFVGCIILGWIQWAYFSANVSYWLVETHTGKGYATEALKLLAQYCFDELHLNRLELTTSVNNPDSAAVAERCGFQKEGVSRQFERINGNFEDHIRYAKLASD